MIIKITKGENCYVHFYPTDRINELVHHNRVENNTQYEHVKPIHITALDETFVNIISPLAFLSDPIEKEKLDLKYEIIFEDFEGQDVKNEPITFLIPGEKGRVITITKDIIDNTLIKTGMLTDDVKTYEYRFWHNKNSCFLEIAVRGFNHDDVHPIIGLVHYGETKSSIFMKALLGDENG